MAIWFLILGWFLSILALLGNSFVIGLIVSRRRLHTSANAFVTSLALADFCVALFVFPSYNACNAWLRYCKPQILASFHYFFFYSSACNLCALMADRFVAVALPLKYIKWTNRRPICCTLFAAWFVPLTVCLLPFTWTFLPSLETRKICEKFFIAFLFTFLEFLPCLIMVVATTHLCCISRKHAQQTVFLISQLRFNHPAVCRSSQKRTQSRHLSAARLITVVVGLFVLCYTFEMVFSFHHLLNSSRDIPSYVKDGRLLFLITNSAANPIVYALLKKDLETELKRLVLGSMRRKSLQ